MEPQQKSAYRPARSGVTGKLITISVITFVLIMISWMIQAIVNERQMLKNSAISAITDSWGGDQTISGPALAVPVIEQREEEKGKITYHRRVVTILPTKLDISAEAEPEIRSRGIYRAILYKNKTTGTAHYVPDFSKLKIAISEIRWNEAWFTLGVSDVKGIAGSAKLSCNGIALSAEPGVREFAVVDGMKSFDPEGMVTSTSSSTGGFTFPLPTNWLNRDDGAFDVTFEMTLNGSGSIKWLPLGDETSVKMSSSWPSPGFVGSSLPKEHEIRDSGFTARWSVLNFNRSYPQIWLDDDYAVSVTDSRFGVNLVSPVDGYQLVTRSVKYALLFVVLTFTGFFLIEVLGRCRLHPIQYTLVGSALTVFYILLLSLSEQIGFGIAYGIASTAIVLMITLYSAGILKRKTPAVIMGTVLSMLYGFLYILLQLEHYSLLLGSVVLVVVLAGIMFGTRNVDWFSVGKNEIEG